MNKYELIEKIAQRVGSVTKKQADEMLHAMLDIITEALKADDEVVLTGFGTFMAKHRVGRIGVNPQSPSNKIQIPPIIVAKFKAGKALKDALKEVSRHSRGGISEKPKEASDSLQAPLSSSIAH